MWLKSDRLQLVGKADVVEFHDVGQVSNLPHDSVPRRVQAREASEVGQ